MHTTILMAALAVGVDYGWQPLDEGGFEYIIQIEPELLDALLAGEPLRSDLPPHLRDVRSYRIQVGRNELPRVGDPQAAAKHSAPNTPPQEPVAEPAVAGASPPAPAGRSPSWDRYATPPLQPPRYPDHGFRTETSPPKLPAEQSPPQPADDTPRPFQPDDSSALVQLSYGTAEANGTPAKAEEGPSAAPPQATEAPRPWLPLTFTLLCLFVSLGGNAYLGMQWWTIRLRCRQLLRDRRLGRTPQSMPAEEQEIGEESSEAAEDEEELDEEDQDVRAITEEELARKHRRTGS